MVRLVSADMVLTSEDGERVQGLMTSDDASWRQWDLHWTLKSDRDLERSLSPGW